jgi:hypothetical protein
MKHSQSPLPQFPHSEGEFSVDYRNHNGRFFIGSGEWMFETDWSAGGANVIHVMNDPSGIRGVAVAPGAQVIEDVTESVVDQANFTSRHRTPTTGQVVIFENTAGYFAAVELHSVTHTPEGQPGTAVKGRYRILIDRSRNFADSPKESTAELRGAVHDALNALSTVEPETPIEYKSMEVGMGHNNPPPDQALDASEYSQTVAVLTQLDQNLGNQDISRETMEVAEKHLSSVVGKITNWAKTRLKLIEEGFFRGVGALAVTGMAGLGVWAIVAGKLEMVIRALQTLLQ